MNGPCLRGLPTQIQWRTRRIMGSGNSRLARWLWKWNRLTQNQESKLGSSLHGKEPWDTRFGFIQGWMWQRVGKGREVILAFKPLESSRQSEYTEGCSIHGIMSNAPLPTHIQMESLVSRGLSNAMANVHDQWNEYTHLLWRVEEKRAKGDCFKILTLHQGHGWIRVFPGLRPAYDVHSGHPKTVDSVWLEVSHGVSGLRGVGVKLLFQVLESTFIIRFHGSPSEMRQTSQV